MKKKSWCVGQEGNGFRTQEVGAVICALLKPASLSTLRFVLAILQQLTVLKC